MRRKRIKIGDKVTWSYDSQGEGTIDPVSKNTILINRKLYGDGPFKVTDVRPCSGGFQRALSSHFITTEDGPSGFPAHHLKKVS